MLLFIAVACGLASLYMAWQSLKPLLDPGLVTVEAFRQLEDETLDLLSRRDQLVAELRDLEFEAALNKIDDRDLAALRSQFEREAIAVVRQIDEAVGGYEQRIEADLEGAGRSKKTKKVRKKAEARQEEPPASDEAVAPGDDEAISPEPDAPCPACGELLEADATFCDACGQRSRCPCAACGALNRAAARFCKGCGAEMPDPDPGPDREDA